jgi:arylsulfatase A-like enzyme
MHLPINTIIFYLLLIALWACQTKPITNTQRDLDDLPNIIFLLTDDQADNSLSGMGHPIIDTPNLDNLLNQGVWFSNTYIATPVCAPSRISLFTGMHERKHDIGFSSLYKLTESQWAQTYPALLREKGYYTGFIGKFGVEYYEFRGNAHEKFDFWRGHDGWAWFFPKDNQSNSSIPYHDAKENMITYIMGECIESFLDSVSAGENQPFNLSVSFNIPHGTQKTRMYTDYEDWTSMSRPANENPKLKGHPFYDTLYRNKDFPLPEDCCTDPYKHIPKHILDQDAGRADWIYKYNYNPTTNRECHIRYMQQIAALDHIIGNMVKSLEKRGLAENTIIIYGSDHGLLMGEYGMGGKALLYDLTVKIPFFIYDPRLPENKRGQKLEHIVSSLDIPSTILDYANIEQPANMDGKSLVPLINNEANEWRDELFLESLFTQQGNPIIEGIRVGNWKYIRFYVLGRQGHTDEDLIFDNRKPDFEQLFNLEADPKEHRNLIDVYRETKFLEDLRNKCAQYSKDLNMERKKYKEQNDVALRQ